MMESSQRMISSISWDFYPSMPFPTNNLEINSLDLFSKKMPYLQSHISLIEVEILMGVGRMIRMISEKIRIRHWKKRITMFSPIPLINFLKNIGITLKKSPPNL